MRVFTDGANIVLRPDRKDEQPLIHKISDAVYGGSLWPRARTRHILQLNIPARWVYERLLKALAESEAE